MARCSGQTAPDTARLFTDQQFYTPSRRAVIHPVAATCRRLGCDAVILAIGTVPNLKLARDCGLACKRGVVVDAHLQTSEPSVYALGKIAEFKGTLYGITAASLASASLY